MKAREHSDVMKEYALAFQQGDEKALAFFYSEFYPALALYANKYLQNRSIAEEIASEAFIQVWKMHNKLHSYQTIQACLYIIVRRSCQRSLKQEYRRTKTHKEAHLPDAIKETAFDNLVRAEAYRLIHSSLKNLAPGSRKVLTMHYLDGKTTGEIAKELQLSPSTIQTQKINGLKALRKIILRPLSLLSFLSLKIFLIFH